CRAHRSRDRGRQRGRAEAVRIARLPARAGIPQVLSGAAHVNDFQWGIIARAIYAALLWLTVLLAYVSPALLPWHLGLLLFLGLGLKPLLLRTGLWLGWMSFLVKVEEVRYAEFNAEAGRRVDRKRRDDKFRNARRLSRDLPPNW